MNLTDAKDITINGKSVSKISIGSSLVWEKNHQPTILPTKLYWQKISDDSFYPGNEVWTDGYNTYRRTKINNVSVDLIFNPSNNTWNTVNIDTSQFGSIVFYPSNVWTGKVNGSYCTYIMASENYYSFDRLNRIWIRHDKYVNGVISRNLDLNRLWTDGTDVFYIGGLNSGGYYSYKKDGDNFIESSEYATSDRKAIQGYNVWYDKSKVYCSDYDFNKRVWNHYVLDRSTSTFIPKTWSGYTEFQGRQIWTDGENTYCTEYDEWSMVLDSATSTFHPITQYFGTSIGDTSVTRIWHCGNNTYYTNNVGTYKLVRKEYE